MMKVERKEGTVVDGKGKAHGVYSFRKSVAWPLEQQKRLCGGDVKKDNT